MKAYGVRRKDAGCCPGHDKYPHDSYGCTRASARRARLRPAKKHARTVAGRELRAVVREGST
jgi:hypothetical protein